MKICISSDSVCDLSSEQITENKINIIPLTINLGDNAYLDTLEIKPTDIFSYVEKNKVLPKTSAVNEFQYDEAFEKLLKEYDAIIHFTISSDMSSCYANACKSAKKFKNVAVIDSRNLSTGVGLLVMYACQLVKEGLELDEIVEKVTSRIPFVQASFVVERLDYLYKGGRCSALQLFGANLLRLRPSILVSDGKMGTHKKYRGKMKDVVHDYIKDTLAEYPDYDDTMCFITYSSATDEMLESAKNAVAQYGHFKNVYYTNAGCTVTSHCGEHTLGILFITNGKKV